ncbi:MAG: type V CRISPR-associated protein Cas12b [Opitutaceae bacterium]|jgi:hypothetical protein
MNRIYQGRVTAVELRDGSQWKPFDPAPRRNRELWSAALWGHHELFQDAVNYYTLALAAMAEGVEGDSAQAKALQGWTQKVRETWKSANRKAETFDGPQKRLSSILKLAPSESDFSTATKRVMRSSRANPAQRAAALVQLLSDKGDLNQLCRGRIPWLATPFGKLDATSKADASSQEAKRQQSIRQFHQFSDSEALAQASSLDLGLLLTQPPTEFVEGAAAVKMLLNYFLKASARIPDLKQTSAAFEKFVSQHSEQLRIPSPGRKPSGLYPIAAVFKFCPSPATLTAFRQVTKTLAEAKDKEIVSDPVADARVDDQPHFDYFTNLALVSGGDGERDTRAVWFEFDLAAFIEAIKAPRRYFEDTQKREDAADRLRRKIAAMKAKGHEASGTEDEDETLPGFEGDTRIELLQQIVQHRLAWLAEVEDGESESGPKEYAIRERTIRGFAEIKRRWCAAVEAGRATEKRLLEILAEGQTEHRDDFGSAPLYQELAKPEFHPIWRNGGTQPWHAEDPLVAWLDYKDLQAELQDKERAIRFTPAHPTHSPRFFIFPKKSEASLKKTGARTPKPGLLSRHEPGQLSFTAGIVLPTAEGLSPAIVRIHYSAPRLRRDQLRASGDSNLHEAPWLQPMMSALGLDDTPERVNFSNCCITLQPADEKEIQLAFPVEVEPERIQQKLGHKVRWNYQASGKGGQKNFAQFNYSASEPRTETSLRWPSDIQFAKDAKQARTREPEPWHQKLACYSCLATDLGQRDAGAFARLLVSGNNELGERPSRFIGATGNKQWRAALERSGLFRLPGEDAQVWREKSQCDERNPADSGKPFDFREELWGEHGRPARDWEAYDTTDLMRALEAVERDAEGKEKLPLLPDGWRDKQIALSFPEQNDKLLVAMRRYQSRISRLHRWCWFLNGDDKQQQTARVEIAGCDDTRLVTPELKALTDKRDPRSLELMQAQLCERLKLVPDLLVRISNRILPLHGRSWRWEAHPSATPKNPLHRLTQNGPSLDSKERPVWLRGQRGLSMERIEQIEELRKRFQSLNQMQRRAIGGKPPTRRDESVPDPCPELLDKLDAIKEQRVNQTAHMILAEALGLRLAPPPANKKALLQQRDQHGVYEKIADKGGRWIGPVDFIVIEDLSRYRASQGRAPRENSRLMKWCHRAVRDKLKQLCDVFGLPVLETPAAYSSRFCSRSGVPGFRAVEVTAGFIKQNQWAWLAGKQDAHGNRTADAHRLHDLDLKLNEAQAEFERKWTAKGRPQPCPRRTLLVPMSGGPVFVPVAGKVAGAELQPAVVQADVNAAITLALRAIADPKLWAIHPRLRSQREGSAKPAKGMKGKPKQDAMASPTETRLLTREKRKFGDIGKLLVIHRPAEAKPDDTRQPNFFADFAGLEALARQLVKENSELSWLAREWTSAEISDEADAPPLLHGKSYWGCVKAAQWRRIAEINNARLDAWQAKFDETALN